MRSVTGVLIAGIVLTIVTWLIERFTRIGRFGLEFPLIAFLLGLLVGEVLHVERSVFRTLNPWVFVDASLILLGIVTGFDKLGALRGRAGMIAVVNVAAAIAAGMYLAYRLGIDERFAATFVSGGSVCGISASIATGRAANAEFVHLVIAMLLIAVVGAPFAVAVAYVAPSLGRLGGALVGGVVDGTPVVKSIAESLPKPIGEVAVSVKYAQNALIPIVAIVLAYTASRLGGFEARLPLAIILMLVASIAATFVKLPPGVVESIHAARNWLLALAMVLAGMATPISALRKPGVRNAILVFIVIEIVNVIIVSALAATLL